MLFDAFDSMDREGSGAITRSNFFWALGALGTSMEFQKLVNKARLSQHFYKTVQELPLDAFIRRICPSATDQDISSMLSWAKVRKAHNLAHKPGFKAKEAELRHIFSLMDPSSTGQVPIHELVQAKILTQQDIRPLYSDRSTWMVSFEDFAGLMLERYCPEGSLDDAFGEEGGSEQSWRVSMRLQIRRMLARAVAQLVVPTTAASTPGPGQQQQPLDSSRPQSAATAELPASHACSESLRAPAPPATPRPHRPARPCRHTESTTFASNQGSPMAAAC